MTMDAAAAVGALNSLIESVRALRSLRSQKDVDAVRADLLGKVIDAQQAVLNLQALAATERERRTAAEKRVSELEQENAHLRDWSEERKRYALVALGPDACAYKMKDAEAASDEPVPHLCAHCFEDAQRSILQAQEYDSYTRILECPRCKTRVTYPIPKSGSDPPILTPDFPF